MHIKVILLSGIFLFAAQSNGQIVKWLSDKLGSGADSNRYAITLEVDRDRLREMILEDNPDYTQKDVENKVKETVENSGDIAVEIIRERLSLPFIRKPVVTPGSFGRIHVTFSGANDGILKIVHRCLETVGFLEFRLVYPQNERYTADLFSKNQCPPGYRIVDIEGRKYYLRDESYASVSEEPGYETRLSRFAVPDGSRSYQFMLERDGGTDENPRFRPVFVRRSPELTGAQLQRARVDTDALDRPVISLQFTKEGSRRFATVTERNVGNQLAIILDGTVYSAPVIQTAILNGYAQISGNFSREEATLLKTILNASALPAPLRIVREGPVP